MAQEQPLPPEQEEAEMKALKALFDAADAEAEAEGAADAPSVEAGEREEAEGAAMEQEGAVETEMATEGVDLEPLMETLGATEERAKMLYDAAQQIQTTQGKTPQELSDMIASDFDVLMQLEMVAARGEGGAMEPPAAGQMPAGPGAAAPGQMMPPEGM